MNKRVAKYPTKEIKYWTSAWTNACRSNFMQINAEDLNSSIKIAGLITLADSTKRKTVFWALSLLLIGYKRKKYWENTIAELPKNKEDLVQLSLALRYYEKLANKGKYASLTKGRFNPVTIVQTLGVVGDSWMLYLDLWAESFYTYPAKIFSQEMIESARIEFPGRFGDFAEQHGDFSKEISESVKRYEV